MILRTLRARFIISHVLPIFVAIPLMGLALIYVLETSVVLPNLVDELTGEATLLAELAREHPAIWSDPAEARAFVARAAPHLDDRLMLVGVDGRILASSDPKDAARVGQPLTLPGLALAARGTLNVRTVHERRPDTEIVDVLGPVPADAGGIAGIIRVTLRADTVIDEFLRRRYLIAGILAGGVVVGSVIGWVLAVNLGQPLQQVTESVQELAEGQRWMTLPEPRVEEIGALVRAFNSLVKRLRSLEESRRQLLANLIHELGRPLGALRSAVQALQRGAGEQADLRRELLAGIDDEINRLGRLLNDLVRLHDRVLGPLELEQTDVAVRGWLLQILTPWREAARRKGLEWDASIPTDLPTARIDADRLAQAVGNLLSNAIKFTPTGGTVSVAAGVEEQMLWIRVADTGPGIPRDEREAIFQPFYRGRGNHRFPQGMGLGLAIARDLVTAHAGRLDLESNHGTCFTIRVPIHPGSPA